MRIFDAANGGKPRTVGPFEYRLRKVSFSEDGDWISVGPFWGDPGAAMIIDVATGKVAQLFEDENQTMPTFAPTGGQIATGTRDGHIFLWDWDGVELTKMKSWDISPSESVRLHSLEYNSDGTRLISGDYSVRVWEVKTRTELATLKVGGRVHWLSMNPQEDAVAFFMAEGIRLWKYAEKSEAITGEPLAGSILGASFSVDDQRIAMIASPSLAASPGGVRSQQGPVAILSAVTGETVLSGDRAPSLAEPYTGLSWTADSRHVVLGAAADTRMHLVDARTGESEPIFSEHTMPMVLGIDVSGNTMVSVGWDGIVRSWDIPSRELTSEFPTVSDDGRQLEVIGISPRGDRVALVFRFENAIEIWDVASGERLDNDLKLYGQYAWWTEFSNDGKHVFVGGTDGNLTMFDVESGVELNHFTGHRGEVIATGISPDGEQIVSGDSTGRIIVWDVASASRLVTLSGVGEAVTSLDWSSDGLSIVAGRNDGTVQIWKLPKSP